MLLIRCTWCGDRDEVEFRYGGQAHLAYPDDPVPARTVAMRNTLSVRQNAQWFQERLQGEGWKPADANRCQDDGCVQRYERGDSKLTLMLSGAGGQSQIVLNELRP